MKKVSLSIFLTLFFFTACSPRQRYVPVVKYSKPSIKALKTILHGTYGDRYRYAGQGPNRFDCSGLIYYSYATMNLWLPRRAIDQSRAGKTIHVSELRYGDLIFFDTKRRARSKVNHVGIYMGNGSFLHASSAKRRVILSSLRKPFYASRLVVCKRVMPKYRTFKRVAKASKKEQRVVATPQNSSLF